MLDVRPDRVCVSGVNGFVGSQVAKDLLVSGYAVNGTVRNLTDASVAHLTCLPGAKLRFRAFEADLTARGAFDEAVRGCKYAVHCASPSAMENVAEAEMELVKTTVQGTLSFLGSCGNSGSVKKVVMIGCSTAIADGGTSGVVLDEEAWNDKGSPTQQPYVYGKTLAEKRAWMWTESSPEITLNVINPTGVIGPSLVKKISPTSAVLKAILMGHEFPGILDLSWSFVDVRDVSRSVIAALESDCASGRYICADTEKVVHMREVVSAMKGMGYSPKTRDMTAGYYTRLAKVMSKTVPGGQQGVYIRQHLANPILLSSEKIKRDLKIRFTDPGTAIRDTILDLAKWGHIPPPAKAKS